MTEWEEMKSKGDYWTPEKVGDELVGKLIERAEGQYGPQFTIELADKERIHLPSHKVLQARMENVVMGSLVRIVYGGTELPKIKGRNPMALYTVFVAKQ
jgi:hypothetical protein